MPRLAVLGERVLGTSGPRRDPPTAAIRSRDALRDPRRGARDGRRVPRPRERGGAGVVRDPAQGAVRGHHDARARGAPLHDRLLPPARDGRLTPRASTRSTPRSPRPGRATRPRRSPTTRPCPGHHLQLAISQELTDLPDFRRHIGPTAFVEGWGLYTERLADEMGLYSGDLDRIGVLSFDAWRACRLVVDTGMHALGWTRQQAIDYMLEHTVLAENNVVNEIDRYIAIPAQALAYKIGQREILRLRAEAAGRSWAPPSTSAASTTPSWATARSASRRWARSSATGRRELGWPEGLEPSTGGSTNRCSAIELRPPSRRTTIAGAIRSPAARGVYPESGRSRVPGRGSPTGALDTAILCGAHCAPNMQPADRSRPLTTPSRTCVSSFVGARSSSRCSPTSGPSTTATHFERRSASRGWRSRRTRSTRCSAGSRPRACSTASGARWTDASKRFYRLSRTARSSSAVCSSNGRTRRRPQTDHRGGTAMTLVDRYLGAVRDNLPRAQRDDIIELSEDSLPRSDGGRDGRAGSCADRDEQAAILKGFGNPLVCRRTLPRRRAHGTFGGGELSGRSCSRRTGKVLTINVVDHAHGQRGGASLLGGTIASSFPG